MIEFLQIETEVRERGERRPLYLHTARLTESAVEGGLGRRLEPHGENAYDVLTPKGQRWVTERLAAGADQKPRRRYKIREIIRDQLARGMTQTEIARSTGLSRQLVSHHARQLRSSLSNETPPCL